MRVELSGEHTDTRVFSEDGKSVIRATLSTTMIRLAQSSADWPAPGSEDTELGVLMELEVGHGETEIHAGVQA